MEVPIFPLNGAVLFPGTSLPLNIFEKKYISYEKDRSEIQKKCVNFIYKYIEKLI